MKLEANVVFNDDFIKDHPTVDAVTTVNIDADYCTADSGEVYEYAANELYDMYGVSVNPDDFKISNICDVVADLDNYGDDD